MWVILAKPLYETGVHHPQNTNIKSYKLHQGIEYVPSTIPIVSLLNHEQFFWIASLAWTSYGGGKYHSLICYLEFQVRNLFLTKKM